MYNQKYKLPQITYNKNRVLINQLCLNNTKTSIIQYISNAFMEESILYSNKDIKESKTSKIFFLGLRMQSIQRRFSKQVSHIKI